MDRYHDYGQFHRINKALYSEAEKDYWTYKDSKLIEYVNGLRWFPTLNGSDRLAGLLAICPSLKTDQSIILISRDIEHEGNMIKSFSYVSRLHHLLRYQDSLPESKRCLYEVIRGRYSQKMKFDLDIPMSEDITEEHSEEIKNLLIDSILRLLPNIDLSKDVIVMTSHSSQKRSYHIIISSYHCNDNDHAQQIYNRCVEHVPSWAQEYIDPKVYSSCQQFRLLGSSKLGKNRPKIFNKQWFHWDKEIIHDYGNKGTPSSEEEERLWQLEESLVSFTAGTKVIDIPQCTEDIRSKMRELSGSISSVVDGVKVDIGDEDISKAHELFGQKVLESGKNFPIMSSAIQELHGAVIVPLRRLYPSRCKVCNRIHEHENPFFIIIGVDKTVLSNCRRSDQYQFLGRLSPQDNYMTPETILDGIRGQEVPLDLTPLVDPQSIVGEGETDNIMKLVGDTLITRPTRLGKGSKTMSSFISLYSQGKVAF